MDETDTLLAEGRLDEAVDRVAAAVRGRPKELRPRVHLAELLCLRGELERADALLDVALTLEPGYAAGIILFRHLIRAAQWREDLYARGRPPTLPAPTDSLTKRLEALVSLRAGDRGTASTLLTEAETARVLPACTVDGTPVELLRDADDLLGDTLELLLPEGEFALVALPSVRRFELQPPAKLRERLWRPGKLQLADGSQRDVWMPLTYPTYPAALAPEPAPAERPALGLGLATAWREAAPDIILGAGLKTWLVGEEAVTLDHLGRIEIAP